MLLLLHLQNSSLCASFCNKEHVHILPKILIQFIVSNLLLRYLTSWYLFTKIYAQCVHTNATRTVANTPTTSPAFLKAIGMDNIPVPSAAFSKCVNVSPSLERNYWCNYLIVDILFTMCMCVYVWYLNTVFFNIIQHR